MDRIKLSPKAFKALILGDNRLIILIHSIIHVLIVMWFRNLQLNEKWEDRKDAFWTMEIDVFILDEQPIHVCTELCKSDSYVETVTLAHFHNHTH